MGIFRQKDRERENERGLHPLVQIEIIRTLA